MKKAFMAVMFVMLLCSAAAAAGERFTVPIGDSPQIGPKDAPITIIEFLDFQ